MLLKVHFLRAAETVEQQYPKVKFCPTTTRSFYQVCVLMDPVWGLFPPNWKVVCDYVISSQIPYCKQEMSFYKYGLVIPFTMYVNNLSATLRHIYSFCNIPIPDHVVSKAIKLQITSHDCSKLRASYDPYLNRSLASLGVDEEKIKEHLTEPVHWVDKS